MLHRNDSSIGPTSSFLLDVSRLVWRAWEGKQPTGIDRTCLAYVTHFGARAQAVVQRGSSTLVMPAAASQQLFHMLAMPSADTKAKLMRLVAGGFLFRRRGDLSGQIYLNVGHTGLDKPGHSEWIQRTGVMPFYFVHDLIPLTHPEYCRPGEPEKHLRRMTALLSLGTGVIANSRETLNELAVFAGLQQALHMPPGLVAPLGVGKALGAATKADGVTLPGRPYFVMLGTIEGRKNHLLILNIWAEMARRLGTACPQLVVIGQRGWESEQACDMLDRSEAIRGHVIELSRCDDVQLAAYMSNARGLLFPSFVEGYGLPLVEALAAGTPVIASDLSVFRELAGDIPDYISPIDGLGWSKAVEAYAHEESLARAAQIARMVGWSPPRWEDHFVRVDRWLAQFSLARRQAPAANG
ncbi:glycosyltransferase family 4 protein [Sphingobium nicotianae]|uniref:Glycosyltransferase family 4 protein n=1 Tax=Sphingobium nicotianae TaxID=2782607 RepID=A0A9X1DCM1_9SPHN|nr:glycosyltransferase family 1 protein [Sphingobium nicotianae]MBT2187523.1 glycosyltransferase family 4 protein [Sphingobium nicotianae]